MDDGGERPPSSETFFSVVQAEEGSLESGLILPGNQQPVGQFRTQGPCNNQRSCCRSILTKVRAFTTSGGLQNVESFRRCGVRNVTFKTLRYPGHLDYMRFLLEDLGLNARRNMLKSLLLNGLRMIDDDLLVIFVTAVGERGLRKA